ELALQHPVHALDLLLLAKLQAVVAGALAADPAVLARLGVDLALGIERAPRALQEEIRPFPAGKLRLRSDITCHFTFLRCYAGFPRLVRAQRRGRLRTNKVVFHAGALPAARKSMVSSPRSGASWADGSRCAAAASRPRWRGS